MCIASPQNSYVSYMSIALLRRKRAAMGHLASLVALAMLVGARVAVNNPTKYLPGRNIQKKRSGAVRLNLS